MPYYRASRMSCGGVIARVILVTFLGIIGLVCFANRSWFEAQAVQAFYGDSAKIHAGAAFRPGANAVEDGVRQTAVLLRGVPHVEVTSPPDEWRRHHKDAKCVRDRCVAVATTKGPPVSSGEVLSTVLGGALLSYIVWLMVVGDAREGRGGRYGRYRR